MCTNFVFIKKDGTSKFAEHLKVDESAFIHGAFRPGAQISIVAGGDSTRAIRPAIWWLYLKQTDSGLKPHSDYFSVNTNYKKLPQKAEYKTSRCIVPATAFMESQGGKNPHLLEPADDSVMGFGGLYKEWTDKVTGEIVTSASIITLAGHKALENIHRKSTPLWLPQDTYEMWLDSALTDTAAFNDLLTPSLQTDLTATPIDKVSSRRVVGDPFIITSE